MTQGSSKLLHRLGWFVLIWSASVTGLAIIAWLIRMTLL